MSFDINLVREAKKLNNPLMLVVWPEEQQIGNLTAKYLFSTLGMDELGTLEFPHSGVLDCDVLDGIPYWTHSHTLEMYIWRDPSGKRDLILCHQHKADEAEPYYSACRGVVDFAKEVGIELILTIGNASGIPELGWSVFGIGVDPEDIHRSLGLQPMPDGYLAGGPAVLLRVASDRDIACTCIGATVPKGADNRTEPYATMGVLRVLSQILQVDFDLSTVSEYARPRSPEEA